VSAIGLRLPNPGQGEGAKVDSSGGTMIVITDNMSVGLGGERDLAEKKIEACKGMTYIP